MTHATKRPPNDGGWSLGGLVVAVGGMMVGCTGGSQEAKALALARPHRFAQQSAIARLLKFTIHRWCR